MRESAQAGYTYVSRERELGIPEDFYEKMDVHIHVPKAQLPKTDRLQDNHGYGFGVGAVGTAVRNEVA